MFAPAKASIAKIGAVGHPFDARYAMAHARRVALAADSPSKTLAIQGWDKAILLGRRLDMGQAQVR